MKAFAFGVVIGALACFGIIRASDPKVAQEPATEPSLSRSVTTPTLCSDSSSASATASPHIEARTISEGSAGEVTRTGIAPVGALPNVSPEPAEDWIERLSEAEARQLCSRERQLRQARERAAKDAEPKDAGWAYSMEQLMRQHIEMQLSADKYRKLRLECRTTFCELRMEGTSADGQELAHDVLRQIQHQDWSDVVQKGSGGGSDSETWYVEYDWFRPRTDSERQLWMSTRERQR
jgi:hypothetical protein